MLFVFESRAEMLAHGRVLSLSLFVFVACNAQAQKGASAVRREAARVRVRAEGLFGLLTFLAQFLI